MLLLQRFRETPDKKWDIAGVIFGGIGCFSILGQLLNELHLEGETSLSLSFLLGYIAVFCFWFLYGLRFNRPAIIITNAACLVLQLGLFLVVTL